MRSPWWIALVGAVVAVGACGDADAPEGTTSGGGATAFTWETTLDQDGDGYALTVEGVVGDDHAAYTLHVEPLVREGGGDVADFLAHTAGAAVNGSAPPGAGVATSEGEFDPDGRTEVRVLGDQRWYRNPWLLDRAAPAMGDAEWVRVPIGEPVIADLATAVLNERYDRALRRLLAAVAAGDPLEAPTPGEESSELDEVLTPWIGLAGPAYPIGAPATVTGDAGTGTAEWRQVLTAGSDGTDGTMSGRVEWEPTTSEPPSEPDGAVDIADVTARLGG